MNTKKFKILAIVDGVLIVALVVFMFALKGKYSRPSRIRSVRTRLP